MLSLLSFGFCVIRYGFFFVVFGLSSKFSETMYDWLSTPREWEREKDSDMNSVEQKATKSMVFFFCSSSSLLSPRSLIRSFIRLFNLYKRINETNCKNPFHCVWRLICKRSCHNRNVLLINRKKETKIRESKEIKNRPNTNNESPRSRTCSFI